MNVYDAMASDFNRRRALPEGVASAIRRIILGRGLLPRPCILDLGAGAGRIGRAFCRAGDDYVGVDLSMGMLREFAAHEWGARLVQADGARLPFRDGTFDAVLLVQVLSGARAWRGLLSEAMRVLLPCGALFVGRVVAPEDGVDARMKARLAMILAAMDLHPYRDKPRDDALVWLAGQMPDPSAVTVATWTAARRPDAFLDRHAAGVRFSALPEPVRLEAMRRLGEWASGVFGSLDAAQPERYRFDLTIHRFQKGMAPNVRLRRKHDADRTCQAPGERVAE
jgi:SAM-dependent methyltransferase